MRPIPQKDILDEGYIEIGHATGLFFHFVNPFPHTKARPSKTASSCSFNRSLKNQHFSCIKYKELKSNTKGTELPQKLNHTPKSPWESKKERLSSPGQFHSFSEK
jgi:ribosomal protein RSM22 (predicted rRNA methylase)